MDENFQMINEEELARLAHRRDLNSEVIRRYATYLMEHATFITQELVDQMMKECEVSQEYAFFILLTAICDLDMDQNPRDMELATQYFLPSVKKLDPGKYEDNPYYKNIKIPKLKYHNWEFRYETYQPFEGFIYNDIVVNRELKEIPRMGFFDKEFHFPAVLESNIEWMTITPNEIETMQPVLDCIHGDVVTFGLGLGYFTYMASLKESVTSITVVELDKNVIHMFTEFLLPQFEQKEKVTIIMMDAFEFVQHEMLSKQYNYAFVDLWHNASDGLSMYIKMKKLEHFSISTKFEYWIEDTLLSYLRWYVFDAMEQCQNDIVKLNSLNIDEILDIKRLHIISDCLMKIERDTPHHASDYLTSSFLRSFVLQLPDEFIDIL